jgi:thiol-disulfide isomerase/thioredoxin
MVDLYNYAKHSKGTVVMFICNHCPYVKHINQTLVALARTYIAQGVGFIAINSNDVEKYPDDAPDKMAEVVRTENYPFPYLYDESQEVAQAYRAACTPDFFLFDNEFSLIYRGQFDASRPGNDKEVTGSDLKHALDAMLQGQQLSEQQVPSIGCNIKWKPGNEPDYYG